MKKKALKKRILELQSELHEAIWYLAQERDEHAITKKALESYQEEVTDLQNETDDQLLMLANQATSIVKLMKKVDKLKGKLRNEAN